MEAGYDYTLLGGRPWLPKSLIAALALVVLGATLLGVAGFIYGIPVEAQPVSANAEDMDSRAVDDGAVASRAAPDEVLRAYANGRNGASLSAIAGHQLYPGGLTDAASWVNPLSYEP